MKEGRSLDSSKRISPVDMESIGIQFVNCSLQIADFTGVNQKRCRLAGQSIEAQALTRKTVRNKELADVSLFDLSCGLAGSLLDEFSRTIPVLRFLYSQYPYSP